MKQEPTYHIDVTPEEDSLFRDKPKSKIEKFVPNTFKKVFCVVLGAHILIGAVIVMSSTSAKAAASKPSVNFKESVAEMPVNKELVEVPTSAATPEVVATPTPVPTPKLAEVKPVEPKPVDPKPVVKEVKPPSSDKFIKEYTIKQGDTITSIAKKYKLNVERLIKINNVKDVNKIQVGQKLKFM